MNEIEYYVHNYEVEQRKRIVKRVLSSKQQSTLLKEGYLDLGIVIEGEKLKSVRKVCEKLIKEKKENDGESTYKSKRFEGIYVRDAHLQSKVLLDFLTPKYSIVDSVRQLMGPRVVVRSFSIRCTAKRSGESTMWHSDQRSFISPKPPLFTEPHVLTYTIYLDGATNENGLLYVAPKSHLGPHELDGREKHYDKEHALSFPEGGGILFHSALAHKGGENNSDRDRIALVIHFCPVFSKQANFEKIVPCSSVKSIIESSYNTRDEAFLELLGRVGLKYPLFM